MVLMRRATHRTIDQHVIDMAEALAKEQKQHLMNREKPCFEWSPGLRIEDIYEEEDEQILTISNETNGNEVQEQPIMKIE